MTYEKHLRSSVIGKLPTAAQLAEGQIAINFAASDPFLCIKDSAGTVRRLGGTTASATAPTSPKPGDLWVDISTPALPVLNVWSGTTWVRAGGVVSSSATAPTSPSRGNPWLNTSGTGTPSLSVWDGSKWVPLASTDGPTFTGTPAGPTAAVGTDTTQLATTAFVQAAQLFTRATGTISAKTAGDLLAPAALPAATAAAQGAVRLADAEAITAGTAGRVVDAAQFKVFNGAFFAIDGGFANSTYGGAPPGVDGGRA